MIEIDRLALQVHAAAAPERAEGLTRRVRDAAVAGLGRQRIVLTAAPAGAYVFIERLEFSCAVNGAWDGDAIGDAVLRGLAAALEKRPQSPAAITFVDRVEFLAAFLLALVEGRAWNRWWFEEFDGLKPLTASSALRTLIINEGEAGVAALARLTREGAVRVVRALSAGDARRLFAWFEQRHEAVAAGARALWQLSETLRSDDRTDWSEWLAALISCERSAPHSAGATAIDALRSMVRLRQLAPSGHLTRCEIMADMPLAALRACARHWGVRTEWLDGASEAELSAIADDLARLASDNPRESASADGERPDASAQPLRASTRHGGVFVLLGLLSRLGWIDRWRQRLVESTEPRVADNLTRALALVVSAKALAPGAAQAVVSDAALMLALDSPDAAGLLSKYRRQVRVALRGTAPDTRKRGKRERSAKDLVGSAVEESIDAAAALLLKELSSRILGLAHSSADYLRQNVLALPAMVERTGASAAVGLGRAPLDVLLFLSGVKRGVIVLPGKQRIELRENSFA